MDITNRSWHPLQTSNWNLDHLYKEKQKWQISQSLDSLDQHKFHQKRQFYHNIEFIIHILKLLYYHYFSRQLIKTLFQKYITVVEWFWYLFQTDLMCIITLWKVNVFYWGKVSYESTFTFA